MISSVYFRPVQEPPCAARRRSAAAGAAAANDSDSRLLIRISFGESVIAACIRLTCKGPDTTEGRTRAWLCRRPRGT